MIHSIDDLNRFMETTIVAPQGFIVSRQVYDELLRRVPKALEGHNSFTGVPIVVDDELPSDEIEVAFSATAFRERVKNIRCRDQ